MKKSYLTLEVARELKMKIYDLVHKRKMAGQEDVTQRSVVLELIELGLSALQSKGQDKEVKTV